MRKMIMISAIALSLTASAKADLVNPSRSVIPTIYGGITGVANKELTEFDYAYMGGLRWALGKYGGLGLEYRQFQPTVTVGRFDYKIKGHGAGGYFYLQTPSFKSFVLSLDAGGGVIWADNSELDMNETWIASGRLNLSRRITEFFDLTLFGGVHQLGDFNVKLRRREAKIESQQLYEGGLAFRFYFNQLLY